LIGDIEVATVGACRPLRARAPSGRNVRRKRKWWPRTPDSRSRS